MPYEDKERMAHFYAVAFDWKTNMLGPEMGNYVVAMTSETDEATKRPKKPGTIDGGFYQMPEDELGKHPSVVISVRDIRESMKKIEAGGGRVLGEPMEIPTVGLYVSFLDTEGNRVSLLEPSEEM